MTTAKSPVLEIKRRWLLGLFAGYLVALALVVFLPSKEAEKVTGFVGVMAGWLTVVGVPIDTAAIVIEFVANIVMFIPLGCLTLALWPQTWTMRSMVLLGAVASTFIELMQLLIPGRVTAVSDVIANTAGALLGVFLARKLGLRAARSHG
ncbi:VanZ family protein [Paenarthrobacter sp. NyZ202]|uniref:VanZ family protein n=1 Tax=Paenarthrobacter sp. NyZ202 TaxID=3402689 RepID=UPI003CF9C022